MRLQGKTALVTGAGRGIGRAVALRLAQDGADLTINDIDPANAAAVAGEVRALGRKAQAVVADISREEKAESLIRQHGDFFGGLDILVNNAGIMIVRPLFENSEADWDRILAINLKSVYFCSRAAVPLMKAQKAGKIINTASMGAYIATPLYAAYCASKAAVLSLTESLAKELAAHNIQVNAVCPGIIATDMWAQINQEAGAISGLTQPNEFMNTRVDRAVALKRPGTPDDVAGVYVFLASADADYITGQAYAVNGGMSR
jgi:meso-butanediol dehydrogenase / (S,S)-butanediol dehydrogenase / diacetyl reductase